MGILQGGDTGEDLGEGDEDVAAGLGPDGDVDAQAALRGGVVAALGFLVEVVLQDAGPDHGASGDEVARCDAADGGDVEAELAQGRVDQGVEEGDHDDQGEGVQVGQDVVGDAAETHCGGLGDQVVVDFERVC